MPEAVAHEDLFALADTTAAAVCGAVAIEDPRGRVLAYSTLAGQEVDEPRRQAILAREAPDTPPLRDLYASLRREETLRVEAIEGLAMRPRLVAPVRAGGRTLGSLWALEGGEPLAPDAPERLADAARLTALRLLRTAAEGRERAQRSGQLRALLEGRAGAEAAAIGVEGEAAVIAFALPRGEAADAQLERLRLLDLVGFYCDAFRRQVARAEIGERVYALVAVADREQRERLEALAASIVETAARQLRLTPRAGVGAPAPVAAAARSRRQAERALAVLALRPALGPVGRIEELLADALVLELRDSAAAALALGPLGPLLAQGAKRRDALLATLRAYLDAFGEVPAAAARAGTHPSTFRYRLGCVLELIDLSDPETRLAAELQLRALDQERWSHDRRDP